ncbi:hypothetical protein GS426_07615 [Rhodococcus hoagii]|nr:hypothetical protein [Prescottella equi]
MSAVAAAVGGVVKPRRGWRRRTRCQMDHTAIGRDRRSAWPVTVIVTDWSA